MKGETAMSKDHEFIRRTSLKSTADVLIDAGFRFDGEDWILTSDGSKLSAAEFYFFCTISDKNAKAHGISPYEELQITMGSLGD